MIFFCYKSVPPRTREGSFSFPQGEVSAYEFVFYLKGLPTFLAVTIVFSNNSHVLLQLFAVSSVSKYNCHPNRKCKWMMYPSIFKTCSSKTCCK